MASQVQVMANNSRTAAQAFIKADIHLQSLRERRLQAAGTTTPMAITTISANVSSYHQATSRSAYVTGIFTAGQFTAPTPGTNGNEKSNQFRNAPFVQSNVTLYKDTRLTERLNLQFRFEFYNLFNHPNFQNIQGDLSAGNFGVATAETLPRFGKSARRSHSKRLRLQTFGTAARRCEPVDRLSMPLVKCNR